MLITFKGASWLYVILATRRLVTCGIVKVIEGGFFKAHLIFPPEYPQKPPKMKFVVDFWHPNATIRVCFNDHTEDEPSKISKSNATLTIPHDALFSLNMDEESLRRIHETFL
eukprot:gene16043-7389_t